ncbi:MAG: hypothetical protein ACTSVY_15180 [Candidatus Helarchaeota archaeon]
MTRRDAYFKSINKLIEIFNKNKFFKIVKCEFWRGPPSKSLFGILDDERNSLDELKPADLYYTKRSRENVITHLYTIFIEGNMYFWFNQKEIEVPAYIEIYDKMKNEYGNICIETSKYNGLEFKDFFQGSKDYHYKNIKILDGVFQDLIKENLFNEIIIGNDISCIKDLSQIWILKEKDEKTSLRKFLKYTLDLNPKFLNNNDLAKFYYSKKETIKEIYNRLFFQNKNNILNVYLKPKLVSDFFSNELQKSAEISAGSFIIKDKNYSNKTMTRIINYFIDKTSEIVKIFKSKEENQKDIEERIKKIYNLDIEHKKNV